MPVFCELPAWSESKITVSFTQTEHDPWVTVQVAFSLFADIRAQQKCTVRGRRSRASLVPVSVLRILAAWVLTIFCQYPSCFFISALLYKVSAFDYGLG